MPVTVADATQPARTPTPSPVAPLPAGAVHCGPLGTWRVVVVDRTPDQVISTWLPSVPVRATAPRDLTIPFPRAFATRPTAIGYCVPHVAGERSSWFVVALWRLGPERPEAIALSALERASVAAAGAADVFRPPPDPNPTGTGSEGLVVPLDPEAPIWLPGRYVFGAQTSLSPMEYFGLHLIIPTRTASVDGD